MTQVLQAADMFVHAGMKRSGQIQRFTICCNPLRDGVVLK